MAATVIRYIGPANAEALGYDADDYAAGGWVLEQDDEWVEDLNVPEADVEMAKWTAAEDLELPGERRNWRKLPADYGTAYELV